MEIDAPAKTPEALPNIWEEEKLHLLKVPGTNSSPHLSISQVFHQLCQAGLRDLLCHSLTFDVADLLESRFLLAVFFGEGVEMSEDICWLRDLESFSVKMSAMQGI